MRAVAGGGSIRADVAYPLAEFSKITGLGKAGLRRARREGLVVRRYGSRSFVVGQDFIDHLKVAGRIVGAEG